MFLQEIGQRRVELRHVKRRFNGALVGLGAYLLETKLGDPTIGIIAGLLTAFMILAMWIFPETSKKKAS